MKLEGGSEYITMSFFSLLAKVCIYMFVKEISGLHEIQKLKALLYYMDITSATIVEKSRNVRNLNRADVTFSLRLNIK